ncbi:hypothetical protein [Chondromyces crocatus]|uniref:hypothetical protein n=1 Tax=Chondromyces crocatus TaxID=52 RepID=UPI0009EA9B12
MAGAGAVEGFAERAQDLAFEQGLFRERVFHVLGRKDRARERGQEGADVLVHGGVVDPGGGLDLCALEWVELGGQGVEVVDQAVLELARQRGRAAADDGDVTSRPQGFDDVRGEPVTEAALVHDEELRRFFRLGGTCGKRCRERTLAPGCIAPWSGRRTR